ncbi:hypothetical protein [Staphylococcus pettenkoferi]|nr:hypothetical protein [Staphylococcus pettenkoferi]
MSEERLKSYGEVLGEKDVKYGFVGAETKGISEEFGISERY